MSTYEQDRAIQNRIGLIATNIAEQMGDGWKANKPAEWYSAELLGPAGENIHLYVQQGRLKIHGIFRHIYDGWASDLDNPTITVGPDRDPLAVARDIQRRLLPAYQAALATCRERAERSAESDRCKASNVARVAEVLGQPWQENKFSLPHVDGSGLYGDVRVEASGAFLDFKSVPIDLAIEIVRLIKKWSP